MSDLKTVDIKGKQYVTVNERLKYFRENFKEYSLETELVEVNNDTALMRAVIRNDKQVIVATGTAYERQSDKSSFVNATSHVENAETSAWGRALANFGIGIDENVATADEVVLAIDAQENKPTRTHKESGKASTGNVVRITKLCKETESDMEKLYEWAGVQNSVPTKEQSEKMIEALEKKLSKQLDDAK